MPASSAIVKLRLPQLVGRALAGWLSCRSVTQDGEYIAHAIKIGGGTFLLGFPRSTEQEMETELRKLTSGKRADTFGPPSGTTEVVPSQGHLHAFLLISERRVAYKAGVVGMQRCPFVLRHERIPRLDRLRFGQVLHNKVQGDNLLWS